jgi:hypothetical protein
MNMYSSNATNRRISLRNSKKTYNLRVRGTDAIFLAGRTDVTIPQLGRSSTNFPLLRHSYIRSDFLSETVPKSIPTRAGRAFTFRTTGTIDFFNGSASRYIPDGGVPNGSNLFGLGGISGYRGAEGALVGVFLSAKNPATQATPRRLNFTSQRLGLSFEQLSPKLGQVFFIGDGRPGNGSDRQQKFIAPPGATRLFVGIADGFGFDGLPGAYEDNDGAYRVVITRR